MLKTDEIFLKLLRFASVTPNDDGAFEFIKSYLSDFEVIEINNKPCFALLAFGKRHGTEVKFFDTEEEAIEAQEPTND